ncbi:DegT/DnrJ/EryC1/StrS family aminotransferase [Cognataquiflexum rubidum]|uniref:DegT/DnrJ/EryC1/StrS family aminotransferase n=1 Tax=Cognataquiflexum rubidum TaxID=2922273 RepID=UPI001F12A8B4|nr:DegT/DnrJ/EryC1/StrS family aminotransferase [Cognataquiflexum rubidum]MCH6234344.1 DegT/DnrJ/EryC1/StrS family aminotransferase [Cognataquiflexum rubidum]
MNVPIPFLDLSLADQELKTALERKFSEMLSKGIFSGGEEVELFAKNFGNFLGTEALVSPCSNGTDALEIALRALEIGNGDEVIVPALTWVSTAEAVKLVGAKPVFIDTDPSGLMDLNLLDKVSPNTKAVIPVHLYGKMVEMKHLIDWARPKGIKVIEDNAQGFGAIQDGKSAGCWGDVGCFSFYPTKNLGALGEAGALSTSDKDLSIKINMLINHGQPVRDQHEIVGRNARIDSIQAGFLNIKLEYFKKWQEKRKYLAAIYLDHLSETGDLILPYSILDSDHNAHLFVIQTAFRSELKHHLQQKGIQTSIHYPTILPKMVPYHSNDRFPNAEKLASSILSLPLNPFMTKNEVLKVIYEVKLFYGKTS